MTTLLVVSAVLLVLMLVSRDLASLHRRPIPAWTAWPLVLTSGAATLLAALLLLGA
jgi:hypothetical protein